MENDNQILPSQPLPPIPTPKKWYQHKGIITIIVLLIIGAIIYFWYWQTNRIDKFSTITLQAQTVPSNWTPFSAEGWQVSYPPGFHYLGKKIANSYNFVNTSTGQSLIVFSKDTNTMPEAELLQTIQKKYNFDVPEALLAMEKLGAKTAACDGSSCDPLPKILLDQIVYINGLKGAQFATEDSSLTLPAGDITIKTSFEKNGRLVDLVMFTNSVDPNSPVMQTYSKFLSSFQFQ